MRTPALRRLLLLPVVVLAVLLLPDVAPAADSPRTGFRWPLEGRPELGRRFEPPRTAWGAGHRGVDLLADPGTPVLAAADGRITYAGLLAGRGVVTVTHADGLRTTYEPVQPVVTVGEEVARGQRLATLASGHASCPDASGCLHWGLLRGSSYLDPLALIRRGQVRLLPTTPGNGDGAGGAAQPVDLGADRRTPAAAARPPVAPSAGEDARSTLAVGLVLTGAGVLVASRLRG